MKSTENKFVVKVIEYSTKKVEKTSDPMSKRKADLVDRGMNRNLDHDRFFTVTEPVAA